jgi:predicted CopG family antitoxin
MNNKHTTRLNVDIDEDTYRRALIMAINEKRSLSAIVRELITNRIKHTKQGVCNHEKVNHNTGSRN